MHVFPSVLTGSMQIFLHPRSTFNHPRKQTSAPLLPCDRPPPNGGRVHVGFISVRTVRHIRSLHIILVDVQKHLLNGWIKLSVSRTTSEFIISAIVYLKHFFTKLDSVLKIVSQTNWAPVTFVWNTSFSLTPLSFHSSAPSCSFFPVTGIWSLESSSWSRY